MDLSKLLLDKSELPILGKTDFYVPIHPKFFDPHLKFDPTLATEVFPKTAEEWYTELSDYVQTCNDAEEVKTIRMLDLKERPRIIMRAGVQRIEHLSWSDDVSIMENGFVNALCISRNHGGTLHVNPGGCDYISVNPQGDRRIHFTPEKVLEFSKKDAPSDRHSLFVYSQHNLDDYSGALFLRNWAINYMNAVFKSHSSHFLCRT